MKHLRLIKLLYIAERTSLDRFGRPIIGDRYVSVRHGPALSNVYNLIKEEVSETVWSINIERDSPTPPCA